MSYHTLSKFLSHLSEKSNVNDNFKFSFQSPSNFITYCHILSRLLTPYHILTAFLDRKLKSRTTLNLVPRLLKMLSDIVTSYQVLSHLVKLYPPSLIEK